MSHTGGFCTGCGRRMPEGATFCTACGKPRYRSGEGNAFDRSQDAPTNRYAWWQRTERRLPLVGAILVSVLAIAFLLPELTGYKAEDNYRQVVQMLSADGLDISLDSYQRGWFSSRATAHLLLNGQLFQLQQQIDHGPFPLQSGRFSVVPVACVIETKIYAPEEVRNASREIFGSVSPEIRTVVSLDSSTDTRVAIPPFEHYVREGSGAVVTSKGLEADLYLTPRSSRLYARLDRFRLSGTAGDTEVDGLTLSSDARRDSGTGIWLGNSRLIIDLIKHESAAAGKSPATGAVRNVSFSAATSLESGLLDLTWHITAGQIGLNGLTLGSTAARLELSRIDPSPIAALGKQYLEIARSDLSADSRSALLVQKGAELLVALAKRAPQMSVELNMSAPKGEVRGEIRVGVTQSFAEDALVRFGSDDYSALMRRLLERYAFASGNLTLPLSLESQLTTGKERRLIDEGIFVREDNGYVCRLDYRGGRLLVNGRKLM
jgi:uncharacterized protein YdgA (DUF945 family)